VELLLESESEVDGVDEDDSGFDSVDYSGDVWSIYKKIRATKTSIIRITNDIKVVFCFDKVFRISGFSNCRLIFKGDMREVD